MNRPLISDFFPESFTPKDLNKVFLANPELYRYIQALDGYIDFLEDQPEEYSINEHSRQAEMLRKAMESTDEEIGCASIKTAFGDLKIKLFYPLGASSVMIIKHGGHYVTNEEVLEAIGDQLSEEDKRILMKKPDH